MKKMNSMLKKSLMEKNDELEEVKKQMKVLSFQL